MFRRANYNIWVQRSLKMSRSSPATPRDYQPQLAYPKRIKRKVSKHLFALIWNIYCMRYFFIVHRHSMYQFVKERIDYFNACKYFNFHHLNFQGMLTHLLPMNCLALILLVFSIYFRGCRFTGEHVHVRHRSLAVSGIWDIHCIVF